MGHGEGPGKDACDCARVEAVAMGSHTSMIYM